MASLLRHGAARRFCSSARTTPATVAQERCRRLVHTNEGAGKDANSKWDERLQIFKDVDSAFTKLLNSVAGVYCLYAILSACDDPLWPFRKDGPKKEGAQTDKK